MVLVMEYVDIFGFLEKHCQWMRAGLVSEGNRAQKKEDACLFCFDVGDNVLGSFHGIGLFIRLSVSGRWTRVAGGYNFKVRVALDRFKTVLDHSHDRLVLLLQEIGARGGLAKDELEQDALD